MDSPDADDRTNKTGEEEEERQPWEQTRAGKRIAELKEIEDVRFAKAISSTAARFELTTPSDRCRILLYYCTLRVAHSLPCIPILYLRSLLANSPSKAMKTTHTAVL
jgi:phage terminase Nu1 subunit (DNA packaging protein)